MFGRTLVIGSCAVALAAPIHAYAAPVTTHAASAVPVVAETKPPTRAQLRELGPADQAALVAPCQPLGAGVYCLALGFRDSAPDYGALMSSSTPAGTRGNGDVGFPAWVAARVALPTADRVQLEQHEWAEAAAGEEKALAVHALLSRVDRGLTPGSTDTTTSVTSTRTKQRFAAAGDTDYFKFIMGGYATRQVKSHWCGPATFQSLDWADDDTKQTQAHWADELGTSSAGTAITSLVSKTNSATKWDEAAGTYIVQSVSNWDADKMWVVHTSHLDDGSPAPIIEHPQLLTTYFNYLSYNGSGHFQVGRGFAQEAGSTIRRIGLFEVWNEADWYANGSTTWGSQLVPVAKVLSATKANSFENIGL